MADKINMNVSVKGKSRSKNFVLPLTLDRLIVWIKGQNLDEYLTVRLIEMASKFPTHALPQFRKNFTLMLNRVHAERKTEEIEKGIRSEKSSEKSPEVKEYLEYEEVLPEIEGEDSVESV